MENVGNEGSLIDPMEHPVNRMMVTAVQDTMDAASDLTEASVRMQVGAVDPAPDVPAGGAGHVFNAWA